MKNGQTLLIENDDPTTASRVQSSQEEIDDGLADLVVETTAAMASNIELSLATLQPIAKQNLSHPLLIGGKLNICEVAQDYYRYVTRYCTSGFSHNTKCSKHHYSLQDTCNLRHPKIQSSLCNVVLVGSLTYLLTYKYIILSFTPLKKILYYLHTCMYKSSF